MSWTGLLNRCSAGDRTLFLALSPSRPTLWGRHWNRSMSRLADGPAYVVLAIPPLLLGLPGATAFLLTMAFGFLIELPAYKLIKRFTRRSRPCHTDLNTNRNRESLLPVPDQYSFPSGHTAGAFVLAGATLVSFPPLAVSAYLFALCVGYSRVYNRLHFPADILAGALLGSIAVKIGHTLALLTLGGPA
ncbi:MAG: phosphatase PAP2 family protein [Verrucomicrobia bacterium]|nr:phosphatase PAP2 family protein [Verrucomicrobiota bacterium]MCH8526507.1 phosphatase PAP2 family protein [Kiritimatiellia bacterium]